LHDIQNIFNKWLAAFVEVGNVGNVQVVTIQCVNAIALERNELIELGNAFK